MAIKTAAELIRKYTADAVRAAITPDMKDDYFLARGNDRARVGDLRVYLGIK